MRSVDRAGAVAAAEGEVHAQEDGHVPDVERDEVLDGQLVAHGALHGIAPAIDLRTDRFDDDARLWVLAIQA